MNTEPTKKGKLMRCPVCGHLVKSDTEVCPFCNHSFVEKKPQEEPATNTTPTQEEKPVREEPRPVTPSTQETPASGRHQETPTPPTPPTPRAEEVAAGTFFGAMKQIEQQKETKKKSSNLLYYILAAVGVVILGVLVWFFFLNPGGMQKKISTPLSVKQIEKLAKDHPGFYDYYGYIDDIRKSAVSDVDKAALSGITYQQMYDFLSHYTSIEYCNQLTEQGKADYQQKYIEPNRAELYKVVGEWQEFVDTHDPNLYLNIDITERYVQEEEYFTTYYYPGFYFTLTYPKGSIRDAKVESGLWDAVNETWHYNAHEFLNLESIKDMTSSESYRWKNVYSTSKDIYGQWHMRTIIHWVLLNDGTEITKDDLEQVPLIIKSYLESPTNENVYYVIRNYVNDDIPDPFTHVSNYLQDALKAENEAAYRLCESTNSMGEVVPRGWANGGNY